MIEMDLLLQTMMTPGVKYNSKFAEFWGVTFYEHNGKIHAGVGSDFFLIDAEGIPSPPTNYFNYLTGSWENVTMANDIFKTQTTLGRDSNAYVIRVPFVNMKNFLSALKEGINKTRLIISESLPFAPNEILLIFDENGVAQHPAVPNKKFVAEANSKFVAGVVTRAAVKIEDIDKFVVEPLMPYALCRIGAMTSEKGYLHTREELPEINSLTMCQNIFPTNDVFVKENGKLRNINFATECFPPIHLDARMFEALFTVCAATGAPFVNIEVSDNPQLPIFITAGSNDCSVVIKMGTLNQEMSGQPF